ncbi:MAG: hypothetical protein LBU09_02495, partial [Endomicrobium sp.]|nr:hypothetical protein [Endomicrobium sp.]
KVVANKCDKLPSAVSLDEVCKKAAALFNIKEDEVFAVSAKKKNGFEKLKADIAGFLKGAMPQGSMTQGTKPQGDKVAR